MEPGERVIYLADPLKYGGELLVLEETGDGRFLCEAVHFDEDGDGTPPPRMLLEPEEIELASVWARQAA